ncbi:transketolase [Mitsuokella multacida]|uniref:transketolase n=1 Tax=Mitsuokella multacida TaxID=52226 RepID=UPI002673AA04|nr:transketolase [Mitsuokella multacida]
MDEKEIKRLKEMCKSVREDIVTMTHDAGSGHPGGSLSAVEIMTALYFGGIMQVNPENPDWEDRDRFILSKGHVAPVVYSVLARRGFFPVSAMKTLRRMGSILQGHPHMASTPGLDCSAGSLGQGLSVANGIAMAFRKKQKKQRVYCLMGDGELQEGQIWEAAMTAPQHKLDNVCAIVDYNHVQLDGTIEEIKDLGDLALKWKAFGWNVIETDGNDIASVMDAFELAKTIKGRPSLILAHTIKGKGVSFMENDCNWHGTAPDDEQLAAALKEIREAE